MTENNKKLKRIFEISGVDINISRVSSFMNKAFCSEDLFKIITTLKESNIPIMGGDVFEMINGKMILTDCNWYYNKNDLESNQDYVFNSHNITKNYVKKMDLINSNFYYSIII